jgi:hypothetical protein
MSAPSLPAWPLPGSIQRVEQPIIVPSREPLQDLQDGVYACWWGGGLALVEQPGGFFQLYVMAVGELRAMELMLISASFECAAAFADRLSRQFCWLQPLPIGQHTLVTSYMMARLSSRRIDCGHGRWVACDLIDPAPGVAWDGMCLILEPVAEPAFAHAVGSYQLN